MKKYPIDTQKERIQFQQQRESCLIDNWKSVEQNILTKAKNDPTVKQLGISINELELELTQTSRSRQMRAIKEHFNKPVTGQ